MLLLELKDHSSVAEPLLQTSGAGEALEQPAAATARLTTTNPSSAVENDAAFDPAVVSFDQSDEPGIDAALVTRIPEQKNVDTSAKPSATDLIYIFLP